MFAKDLCYRQIGILRNSIVFVKNAEQSDTANYQLSIINYQLLIVNLVPALPA